MLHIPRRCQQSILFQTYGCARRYGSNAPNPYPWPAHRHPTPHQIFHLPPAASESDIKQRYYDLVRIYHPDSPASRSVPPETAQERFHLISAAYDALRGKPAEAFLAQENASARRNYNKRAEIWRSRPELNPQLDDRWKDRTIIALIVIGVVAFVGQAAYARSKAVSNAMKNKASEGSKTSRLADSALEASSTSTQARG